MSFYSAYYAKQGRDLGRWYSDYHHELRNDPTKRPPQKWSQIAKQTPFATQRDNDWIADTVQNIVSANPYKSKFIANPPASRETVRNLQQSLAELTAERRRIESLSRQPAPKPSLGSGAPLRPSKDLVDNDLGIQRDLKLKLPSPIDMKGNLGGKLDRDLSLKKENKAPASPTLPQRLPSSLSTKGDAASGITLGKPSDGLGASVPTLPSRVQDAIKSTPPNLSSMPSSLVPRNLPAGQGNGLGQGTVLSGNSKPNSNPNLPTNPPLGRFEPPKLGQGDTSKKDPFRNEGLNNALEQSRRLREEALKGRSLTNPPNLNRSIPGNTPAPTQLNPPKGSRIETNKPLQGTPFRQEVQKPRIELPQSIPNLKSSSGATNPPSGIGSQGPNFNFGNGNRSAPAKSNAPTPSLSPASTPRLGNGGITGPNNSGGLGGRLDSMPRLNPGRDRGSK